MAYQETNRLVRSCLRERADSVLSGTRLSKMYRIITRLSRRIILRNSLKAALGIAETEKKVFFTPLTDALKELLFLVAAFA
jgi:hypothetical protein